MKREVIDDGLRPLRNLKRDEDLGFTVDHIRFYFHIFITSVLVKRGDALNALCKELFTKFAFGEEPVGLHRYDRF